MAIIISFISLCFTMGKMSVREPRTDIPCIRLPTFSSSSSKNPTGLYPNSLLFFISLKIISPASPAP